MAKDLKQLYRDISPKWFDDPELFAAYKRGEAPPHKGAPPPRAAERVTTSRRAAGSTARAPRTPAPTLPAVLPVRKGSASPPKGVMLAKVWADTDPTGWWMSEKLDGMRAYWTGSQLYSRNGNPIPAPQWFLLSLPQGMPLDGELWLGRGKFQELMSIVKRQVPNDTAWRKVSYLVFDAPGEPGGFEARIGAMQRAVLKMCEHNRACPLEALQQRLCRGTADLRSFLADVEKQKGEGLMLRRPGSKYSRARTPDLLKVKTFHDAEARITGYLPGKGKHAGRLGAYQCKLLSSGASFDVGTGLSDRDREKPLKVGTTITVSYQELTRDGVPRFPSFVRVFAGH